MNNFDGKHLRHCLCCNEELVWSIDADPNGEMGCVCKRCLAEEEHDFDLEPNVKFDRYGNRVEESNEQS